MKPNFALNLSHDGISLLHRGRSGWLTVGEVALDDPDTAGTLSILRDTATTLEKGGIATKLIIPDSQILYATLFAPGPSDAERRQQITGQLQGRTPYDVSELVFDWRQIGEDARVAVVARETLEEAESFAVENRFNPVSFVAMPDNQSFDGEPHFGETAFAAGFLQGEKVERDRKPVVVKGAIKSLPPAPAPEPEPEPIAEPAAVVEPMGKPAPKSRAKTKSKAAKSAEDRKSPSETVGAAQSSFSFSSRRDQSQTVEKAAPALENRSARFAVAPEAKKDEKPRRSAPMVFPPDEMPQAPQNVVADKQIAEGAAPPIAMPDTEPGPGAAVIDRGFDPGPIAEPPAAAAASLEPFDADRAADGENAPSRRFAFFSKKFSGDETPDPQADEREAMTLFGARAAEQRNSGRMGLVLTLILLVVLAVIAIWSSIFLSDTIAGYFRPQDPGDFLVADEDPGNANAGDVETGAEIVVASLPNTTTDLEIDPIELLDEPELTTEDVEAPVEFALSPEAAELLYVTTGIWQLAPVQAIPAESVGLEDVYFASIDRDIVPHDAVALPSASIIFPVEPDIRAADPLPAGSVFEFDENGLIIATPEGAETPEGALVIAGKPSKIPPLRPGDRPAPEVQEVAATDEGAETDAATENAEDATVRLASFKPRKRPENIADLIERRELGGLTRDELQEIKPRQRPVSDQAAAIAAALEAVGAEDAVDPNAASELAVVASLNPRQRPTDFADTVAKIIEEQGAKEPSEAARVPTETKKEAPILPTRASVAKEATIKNAISLKKVSLIGVYGSPSNRRALVRLPSGRFVKVAVGDKVDGGRVAAIDKSSLSYIKSGRSLTLKLPKS